MISMAWAFPPRNRLKVKMYFTMHVLPRELLLIFTIKNGVYFTNEA